MAGVGEEIRSVGSIKKSFLCLYYYEKRCFPSEIAEIMNEAVITVNRRIHLAEKHRAKYPGTWDAWMGGYLDWALGVKGD